ncbi:hypothetical protein GNZ25_10745 [Burkholderia thailandensis]|nr:hypothetical protein [Burkholderia thailandensis]
MLSDSRRKCWYFCWYQQIPTTQIQFDQLRAHLMKQPTAKIPGTNIEYYGTVDVR